MKKKMPKQNKSRKQKAESSPACLNCALLGQLSQKRVDQVLETVTEFLRNLREGADFLAAPDAGKPLQTALDPVQVKRRAEDEAIARFWRRVTDKVSETAPYTGNYLSKALGITLTDDMIVVAFVPGSGILTAGATDQTLVAAVIIKAIRALGWTGPYPAIRFVAASLRAEAA